MNRLHQLNQWSIAHNPRWLVILRVALGLSLLLKGIFFLSNTVALQTLMVANQIPAIEWLSMLITWIHLLGGVFIIIGLFTRWAVLVQIPILLGAIIFVNANSPVFAAESEFGLSLIIFLLLIFFFAEGGGPISVDGFLKRISAHGFMTKRNA